MDTSKLEKKISELKNRNRFLLKVRDGEEIELSYFSIIGSISLFKLSDDEIDYLVNSSRVKIKELEQELSNYL